MTIVSTSDGLYQAYQTMMRAHQNGMAVVGRYFYEITEIFHDH
jgi:ATP-dependent Clp protease adapter protein ClpS